MAHRSPQQRRPRVRQMKWKIAKLMSARQQNCLGNIFAVSSTKMFSFLCRSGREKFMKNLLSSSYRLSARAKSRLKNAKFAVAKRKKQRFRPPLSDVAELLRLALDTEKKKRIFSSRKKQSFFTQLFFSSQHFAKLWKMLRMFYIANFASEAVCLLHARADVLIQYLIIPKWLASFSRLHNNELINNWFPPLATVART